MLQAAQIACIMEASARYEVPANMLLAIAEQEGGQPGQYVLNRNGTYDIGTMQFNTSYLKELRQYGINEAAVASPGCFPYHLAAWRVRGHLHDDDGDAWTRAANYHSRTPIFNQSYRAELIIKAGKWMEWLRARYPVETKQSNYWRKASRNTINSLDADQLLKPFLIHSTYVPYVPRMVWQQR
jgi:hypothetical protein